MFFSHYTNDSSRFSRSWRVSKSLSLSLIVFDSLGDSRTALHCAAYSGYQDTVQLLLDTGAQVNLQDREGITALHWAASAGHINIVNLLLNSGTLYARYTLVPRQFISTLLQRSLVPRHFVSTVCMRMGIPLVPQHLINT